MVCMMSSVFIVQWGLNFKTVRNGGNIKGVLKAVRSVISNAERIFIKFQSRKFSQKENHVSFGRGLRQNLTINEAELIYFIDDLYFS